MLDYKSWDLLDEFRISHAACLWCGVQPTSSWMYDRIKFPQTLPIYEMLVQAFYPKEPDSILNRVEDKNVTRSDLIELAHKKGQKPAFLFPGERKYRVDERQLYRDITSGGLSWASPTVIEPEPESNEPDPTPPSPFSAVTDNAYSTRVAEYRKQNSGRRPTIPEDEEWRKAAGISRPRLRELRKQARLPDEEKGGAPKTLNNPAKTTAPK